METLKLHALLRAVELGSFSAAADDLGFTPSGISHMVTAVEDDLGFPVVQRTPTGITLTKNGTDIYPALLALARADITTRQEAAELCGLTKGRLVIGAYSSIAAHWIPPVLKKFTDDYPDITIRMLEGIHTELDQWMQTTNMDFCLYSRLGRQTREWIHLQYDPVYCVVPTTHPFASRDSIRPKELEGEPFIMPGYQNDEDVAAFLRRYKVHPTVKHRTIENYSVLSMIECGLGISVMNDLITEGRLNHVIFVPFDPPQYFDFGISIPSLKTASPAARMFVRYLRRDLEIPEDSDLR